MTHASEKAMADKPNFVLIKNHAGPRHHTSKDRRHVGRANRRDRRRRRSARFGSKREPPVETGTSPRPR